MKKTYAVIGLGRFGTAVAERLYALGNEVLVLTTTRSACSGWNPA